MTREDTRSRRNRIKPQLKPTVSDASVNSAEKKLQGEVAIISGGSGSMGEATALLFAKEGANVAVHYSGFTNVSAQRAKKVVSQVEDVGADGIAVNADVSNYGEVKQLVEKVVKEWGKVSLVVSYAGFPALMQYWQEDPLELSDEDLLSAVKVDFIGSYHFIKACKDYMKKERYGKIVLISSSPSIYGEDIGYRFTLGKDLNRMTVRSLAARLIREYGIYLNAIAPGTVETPANRKNYTDEQWKDLVAGIPLGRAGKPEDIARIALFLCSHDSDYVVGQTILADGGEVRV
jgi:3-oxoacyl-[acyl-carrier protein] reductase